MLMQIGISVFINRRTLNEGDKNNDFALRVVERKNAGGEIMAVPI